MEAVKSSDLKRRLDVPLSGQIIEKLGGISAVAKILGVTPAAVSQWKDEGIPAQRAAEILLACPKVSDLISVRLTAVLEQKVG